MGVTLKPIVCILTSHYVEIYYKLSKLKYNYMEDVENNLFRKKTKVKSSQAFFYSERMQKLIERIHPKIWTTLKTLLWIVVAIFVLPILLEDVKSTEGYFQLVFSVLVILLSNATEIADTPLSSLTIGKFIGVLLFYKIFCRLFFSYEKNTPD
jgi:hypothetical protein